MGTANVTFRHEKHILAVALLEADNQPLMANCYLDGGYGFQSVVTVTRQEWAGAPNDDGKHHDYCVAFIRNGEEEGNLLRFATLAEVSDYLAQRWGGLAIAKRWYAVNRLTMPYAEAHGGRSVLRNAHLRPFIP